MMAILSVVAFGAVSGGPAAANTTAFAATIAAASAGDDVWVPNGTYELAQVVGQTYCVLVNKAVRILGQSRSGAVVQMTATDAADVDTCNVFDIIADGVTVESLGMFGNRATFGTPAVYDPALEHHRGAFVRSNGVTFRDVLIHDFTGDGISVYEGVQDFSLVDSAIYDNQRDGLTLAPFSTAIDGVLVRNCQIYGCAGQQIDNEHGPAHHVEVTGCTFAANVNGNYLLALAGADGDSPSRFWNIHDNVIGGSIFAVWSDDIRIESNVISNGTVHACIELSRDADRIQVLRNDIHATSLSAAAGILAAGTSTSGCSDFLIAGNTIRIDNPSSFGIRLDGFLTAEIVDNDIIGPGVVASGWHGIQLRTTVAARPVQRAVVVQNRIRDFGQRGVNVAGNTGCAFVEAIIQGNRFWNSSTPSMTAAISLDDGFHSLQQARVLDNELGAGVAQDIVNTPTYAGFSGLVLSSAPTIGTLPQRAWPTAMTAAALSYFEEESLVTTSAQIRDRMIAAIEATVPTIESGTRFRAHREEVDFRTWADTSPGTCLRRFSVRDLGDYRPAIVSNTDLELRRGLFEVVIAYPQSSRFGRQLLGVEDALDSDMHQIEGAVGMRGYGNFTAANAPASWVEGESSRETVNAVRFLIIRQVMEFYRSMT